jgi:hypothetical protein
MQKSVDPRSRHAVLPLREPLIIIAGVVVLASIVLLCAALIAVPLWSVLVGG